MQDDFALSGRQVWPSMLFARQWEEFPQHVEGIVEHCYALRERSTVNIASQVAVQAKSMEGLFESDFDLFESTHPDVLALRTWAASSVAEAVAAANGSTQPPSLIQVEFTEAWSHITNESGFHDAHYHSGCSWCGIFYVRAGESRPSDGTGAGNGISRFYGPIVTGGQVQDFGNAYLASNRIDVTPKDGLLILFPAYLQHSGLPYRGSSDRVLIAFNTRSWLREST